MNCVNSHQWLCHIESTLNIVDVIGSCSQAAVIGRHLYDDSICFATVFILQSIPSTSLTHDVYRSAVEHYEEICWVLAAQKFEA